MKKKILVSACLCGIKCNWEGKAKTHPKIIAMFKRGEAIPVCPEQLGGLSTPRVPAEMRSGDGAAVLKNQAAVQNQAGQDVTKSFVSGAKETLRLAKLNGTTQFIGKSKSPSCGCGTIHDGTFCGQLRKGDGVTTALLKQNDIRVISSEDL